MGAVEDTDTAERPQKLFVLGHPVGHSKSPAMYNAAYERLGLPWTYAAMDCSDDACARAFLESRDFLSVNITTPYKPLALASASAASPTARLAEGANVLVNAARTGAGEGLAAFNTDGAGCVAFLESRGVALKGSDVVICGTGPTARSIMHAVISAGPERTTLLGRDAMRARNMVEHYMQTLVAISNSSFEAEALEATKTLENLTSHVIQAGAYERAKGVLSQARVIIDATSLGMLEGDPAPYDTALLHAGQVVMDTVYGHGETAFIAAARAAGCQAFDGAGMLVGQAVETINLVCTAAGVAQPLSFDEMFSLMADAAGFERL